MPLIKDNKTPMDRKLPIGFLQKLVSPGWFLASVNFILFQPSAWSFRLCLVVCMTIGVALMIVLVSLTTSCHFGLKSYNGETHAMFFTLSWLNYMQPL